MNKRSELVEFREIRTAVKHAPKNPKNEIARRWTTDIQCDTINCSHMSRRKRNGIQIDVQMRMKWVQLLTNSASDEVVVGFRLVCFIHGEKCKSPPTAM